MKNIIVIAYLLNNWKGSEFAVAWDYITHMSKRNRLTVLYGCCDGFHRIGNTGRMEEWAKQNSIDNVEFIAIKPTFECQNYDYSTKGNFLFYKEYTEWHRDVRKFVGKFVTTQKIDLIHYLGPIGYREPGFLHDLDIPYIWGPIGGFGMIPPKLWKAAFSIKGAASLLLKGLLNKIQSTTNRRVHNAIEDSDVVICATTEWREYVEKLAGKKHHSKILYKPENCINKLYSVNFEKFNSDTINLVFVGWIDSRKALVLILDALKRMKDASKIRLHILGDGDLIEKYKTYTKTSGLDNVVIWHGRVPRDEVFEIMNNSHLMVLPSLMDANTTVIWEAMAMGIPTLALDHFGFHDTIKNGETGFLIKPNNYRQVVNDITSVLIKLQQSNGMSLLQSMAENVVEDRKNHLWEEREKFFENVYNEAINNHNNKRK